MDLSITASFSGYEARASGLSHSKNDYVSFVAGWRRSNDFPKEA